MFGLGGPELLVLFIAFMLLFGAKRLPDLARGIRKSIVEFRKGAVSEDEEA